MILAVRHGGKLDCGFRIWLERVEYGLAPWDTRSIQTADDGVICSKGASCWNHEWAFVSEERCALSRSACGVMAEDCSMPAI